MTFTTRHESVLPRVAVLVVLLGTAGCQRRISQPAPLAVGVTVHGRVLEGGGSAGLGNVEVGLYEGGVEKYARPLTSGTTNASGYFSISSVEPGTYLLRAVRAGFRESNQPLLVAQGPTQELVIRLFAGASTCVGSATPRAAVTNCP